MNYSLTDTIAAVSSPTSDNRVIVRISGPATLDILKDIFAPSIELKRTLVKGCVRIDGDLKTDAGVYIFPPGHSYTGDCLAEIHLDTNGAVCKALIGELLSKKVRAAGPGEFTARSYLNGKMDLAQAEAVNEIITSSNKFQLSAAEKLLTGRLGQQTARIRSAMLDCLSLLEAGLDFSGEDIEFMSGKEAVERLFAIKEKLERLLAGSISYESVMGLPAVGIAGVPNAGKSSLLNKLLGRKRSIVSAVRRTTRDVLTGVLELLHLRCVLFDCAGLIEKPQNILDELAQAAAIEMLKSSSIVLFCVDISKSNWQEDITIRKLISPEVLIGVGTKSDLVPRDKLTGQLKMLKELFGIDFLITSVKTAEGLELLREMIDEKIMELKGAGRSTETSGDVLEDVVALTARHKQAVTEAIENIDESIAELKEENDEVAAMLLRAAYQGMSRIEYEHIDEQVLENIFSRFCIGK